jgi:glycosyltransferase involved in cell wall biosynthesis
MPNALSCWGAARLLWAINERIARQAPRTRGHALASLALRSLQRPATSVGWWLGRDDWFYPGTRLLADPRFGPVPDVLHLHNLHGNYFALPALPALSAAVPTVLTLHDAWLFSGHCAHPLGCERWRSGCGRCPDLRLDPPIRRDATAANWRAKRNIFARSRLAVVAPARWLLEEARRSILASGMVSGRVIPNGIDLSIFRPGDRAAARQRLRLEPHAVVLTFSAPRVGRNSYKDLETIRATVGRLAERIDRPVLCFALGGAGYEEGLGRALLRYRQVQEPDRMADWMTASDLYLHAARADTFPLSVLEALACGTPVVATAVGGIPEQVDDAWTPGGESPTGALVPAGDAAGLAERAAAILSSSELRARLAANARTVAVRRFSLAAQLGAYRDLYVELANRDRVSPGGERT